MPFLYDDINTGVFYRLGRIIKAINSRLVTATITLPAELKNIIDPYEAADYVTQVEGLTSAYEGFKGTVVSERQSVAGFANRTILDRDTVLVPLGVLNANISEVLTALHNQMIVDGKTVNRSTVTLGVVTAASGNTGNGTALTTKVMDGFNAPIRDGLSHFKFNGLNSELAVTSETMTMTCVADSMRDGTAEGAEQFRWDGLVKNSDLDYRAEGSGQGPNLTVANASTIVVDGNFENWTGTGNNTPSSWTIDNGTAGTHVFRESAGSNVYRGSFSMRFAGTGSQATIGVSQAVRLSSLKSRRMYCVSLRIKSSAVPIAGAIEIQFKGTGYTATASEKISIPAASFPASFSLQHFFISLPTIIPSDWKLAIEVTGTLSAGVSVYFDSLTLKEVIYHGGVGAVVVAGSTRFITGDKLTFTVANDNAGVFQTFWRRWWKFQLPSSVTPNIADSLAI